MEFAKIKRKEFLFLLLVVLIIQSLTTKVRNKNRTNSKTHTGLGSNYKYKLLANSKIKGKNLIRNNSNTSYPSTMNNLTNNLNWSGWIKYYKIQSSNTNQVPFAINTMYSKQIQDIKNVDFNEKDIRTGENIYIPDINSFYGFLFNDHFTINDSKNSVSPYDSFDIASIIPLLDDTIMHGGIEVLGNFDEGSCFQVKTTSIPLERMATSTDAYIKYVICVKNGDKMDQLMQILKKLKLQDQKTKNLIFNKIQPNQNKGLQNQYSNPEDSNNDSWAIVQDWSECSVQCGGGISTLQRKCLSNSCQGKEILTKPCNPTPCPEFLDNLAKIKREIPPPRVETRSITNKPEEYIKCKIKEKDVLITKINEKNEKFRIPVRVILNPQTVNIFMDPDDISTNQGTFVVKETEFNKSKTNYQCFILRSPSKSVELCPMRLSARDMSEEEVEQLDYNSISEDKLVFFNEWHYDYNLFKYQCNTVDKQKEFSAKLENDVKQKNRQIMFELDQEKNDFIAHSKHEEIKTKYVNKLATQEEIMFTAMKKEAEIERLIENEEKEKQNLRLRSLNDQLNSMKTKLEKCRLRIKEKARESQLNLQAKLDKIKIESIQEEAKQAILRQREQLKKRIEMIRNRSKRQEIDLSNQISTLKVKISSKMNQSHKKGNSNLCSQGLKYLENQTAYCNTNFAKDINNYSLCKSRANFCRICCSNEFGYAFIDLRDIILNKYYYFIKCKLKFKLNYLLSFSKK